MAHAATQTEEPATLHGTQTDATFTLRIPPPTHLTSSEDMSLLEQAYKLQPQSIGVRYGMAAQLVHDDRFEEAIALLQAWNLDLPRFQLLLAEALRSRETPEANRAICDLCEAALAADHTPALRTEWLATLGKARIKLGELDAARAALAEALALSPHDKDAYKRVANLGLQTGQPQAVLDHAGEMIEAGVLHARVIASQALAFAQLGWMDEARRVAGLDDFLAEFQPEPPPGWDSIEAFSEAVAEEIREHPGLRGSRYGAASQKTWRVDNPLLHRSQRVPELQRLIQREVEAYVARLTEASSDPNHPFLLGRPRGARLRNWCVMAEGEGYEEWHVHQNGWLSGVFYLHVQDHIAEGTGSEGCISFGLPEEVVGAARAAEFGEHIVRPRTGLMMLFPSHSYHRTYQHFGPGRRICFAFDIVPEQES